MKLIDGVNAINGHCAGWKLDPITGEYALQFDHVERRRPKAKRRPHESDADIELRTRKAGGVKATAAERKRYASGFFGQQQSSAEMVVAGALRGAHVQRAEAESRILNTLHQDLEGRRTQGCRTLVEPIEIVYANGRPSFRVTCPCSGDAFTNAWLWAQGKGSSCGKYARGLLTGKATLLRGSCACTTSPAAAQTCTRRPVASQRLAASGVSPAASPR